MSKNVKAPYVSNTPSLASYRYDGFMMGYEYAQKLLALKGFELEQAERYVDRLTSFVDYLKDLSNRFSDIKDVYEKQCVPVLLELINLKNSKDELKLYFKTDFKPIFAEADDRVGIEFNELDPKYTRLINLLSNSNVNERDLGIAKKMYADIEIRFKSFHTLYDDEDNVIGEMIARIKSVENELDLMTDKFENLAEFLENALLPYYTSYRDEQVELSLEKNENRDSSNRNETFDEKIARLRQLRGNNSNPDEFRAPKENRSPSNSSRVSMLLEEIRARRGKSLRVKTNISNIIDQAIRKLGEK
jgi:hypothetical protein